MRGEGRELKAADWMRDEIARIAMREVRDPRIGMLSVTEVRLRRELGLAEVYVSALDVPEAVSAAAGARKAALLDALNGAAGFFRTRLARRSRMKATPRLRFHYDESLARGRRLECLISAANAPGGAGRQEPQ